MAQIDKNTVPASNQMKQYGNVFIENEGAGGIKVLFVGNSITIHSPSESIGWDGFWGMAASSMENDYVHVLERKILETNPDAEFCICAISDWEVHYKDPEGVCEKYEKAREFGADVIVFRFIENCTGKDFDHEKFQEEYKKLLSFLNPKNTKKVVITSSFWKHIGDPDIEKVASELDYPFVYLGDLGERDEMKALGLFEHEGVAMHPGDLGMKEIAKVIFEKMEL